MPKKPPKKDSPAKPLSGAEVEAFLSVLKKRFDLNAKRHKGIDWVKVEATLKSAPEKLWSLHQMEKTGGEPDVVGQEKNGQILFFDCSQESPAGRRSLCYDREALLSRKEHRPANSALDLAAAMGVSLLTEAAYRKLQTLGEFDTKTSSWVLTPPEIRRLDGALFCDRRYDAVFVYHNGASSYYAARGFRAALIIQA